MPGCLHVLTCMQKAFRVLCFHRSLLGLDYLCLCLCLRLHVWDGSGSVTGEANTRTCWGHLLPHSRLTQNAPAVAIGNRQAGKGDFF